MTLPWHKVGTVECYHAVQFNTELRGLLEMGLPFRLPHTKLPSCVYLIWLHPWRGQAPEAILYAGQTKNTGTRMHQHFNDHPSGVIRKMYDFERYEDKCVSDLRVNIMWCDDWELNLMERWLIHEYQPELNVH